jgi:hypothetical protein
MRVKDVRENNAMRAVTSPIVAVLAFVVFAVPSVVLADGRVALVVGNSTYAHIGRLPNPANDARDISAALRRFGFEVTTELDANRVTPSVTASQSEAAIELRGNWAIVDLPGLAAPGALGYSCGRDPGVDLFDRTRFRGDWYGFRVARTLR